MNPCDVKMSRSKYAPAHRPYLTDYCALRAFPPALG